MMDEERREEGRRFVPSELSLPSREWNALLKQIGADLAEEERTWLNAWDSLNLAWSPMLDERRQLLRLGHYLGWFDRKERDQPNP